MNAVFQQLPKLLSIDHICTTSYRPRLNGSTERTHRWLNTSLGIFCEKYQESWEDYLQAAAYLHNVTPIAGTDRIDPFLLVFGRRAPSPEVLSLELPPEKISHSKYAAQLIVKMHETQKRFYQMKADLKKFQKDVYDRSCRDLHIPEGKRVYVKHPRGKQGQATKFIRRFDGPYIVLGHVRGRDDLLKLKHLNSGQVIKAVNVEKVVVVPEGSTIYRITK